MTDVVEGAGGDEMTRRAIKETVGAQKRANEARAVEEYISASTPNLLYCQSLLSQV